VIRIQPIEPLGFARPLIARNLTVVILVGLSKPFPASLAAPSPVASSCFELVGRNRSIAIAVESVEHLRGSLPLIARYAAILIHIG
jgi:hypothetical protein